MKAIRFNGEVLHNKGQWHIELIEALAKREGLTDDDLDRLIEAGEIQFGSVYLEGKKLIYETDEGKQAVYTDMDSVRLCAIVR